MSDSPPFGATELVDTPDTPAALNQLCYLVSDHGQVKLSAWLDVYGIDRLIEVLPAIRARAAVQPVAMLSAPKRRRRPKAP